MTQPSSLNIIRKEHRSLGAVLYTLEHLAEQIRLGQEPNFQVLHGLLTYIDRFLNTYHHPKEDTYLMPMLKARYPQCNQLIESIYDEHIKGERLFVQMLKALSALEMSGDLEYSDFDIHTRAYTSFEKAHAFREEKELFPLASKYLTESDWQAIDSAFEDNNDPLFGAVPTTEFRELFSRIVSEVPAPLGLGMPWSKEVAR